MATRVVEVVPQTVFTVRANSTLQLLNLLDASSFDQVIVEAVSLNPPALASTNLVVLIKTASQPLSVEGFDLYTPHEIDFIVTTPGTTTVLRNAWAREYSAANDEPLLALLAFALRNNTGADVTIDLQLNVIGTGCGCAG